MHTTFITDHNPTTRRNAECDGRPAIRALLTVAMVSFSAITFGLMSGCAKPDPAVEARKAIQAGYLAEDAGTARKDLAAATSAHAPDCISVARNGKESPMSVDNASLTEAFSHANVTFKRASTIEDLKMNNSQGTEAIVNVKHHAEMTMVRPEIQREMTVYIDSSDRDFWVKTPSGWLIKRAKLTSAKYSHSVQPTGG